MNEPSQLTERGRRKRILAIVRLTLSVHLSPHAHHLIQLADLTSPSESTYAYLLVAPEREIRAYLMTEKLL